MLTDVLFGIERSSTTTPVEWVRLTNHHKHSTYLWFWLLDKHASCMMLYRLRSVPHPDGGAYPVSVQASSLSVVQRND